MHPNDTLTLAQSAEYARITKQSVYVAIRKRALKARKRGRCWTIKRADIDAYRLNKFTHRRISGQRVHDPCCGSYSLHQCALILSQVLGYQFTRSRAYWAVKSGLLRASRIGKYYVVAQSDLADYAATLHEQARQDKRQLSFA